MLFFITVVLVIRKRIRFDRVRYFFGQSVPPTSQIKTAIGSQQ
jgi:hypothetical protein